MLPCDLTVDSSEEDEHEELRERPKEAAMHADDVIINGSPVPRSFCVHELHASTSQQPHVVTPPVTPVATAEPTPVATILMSRNPSGPEATVDPKGNDTPPVATVERTPVATAANAQAGSTPVAAPAQGVHDTRLQRSAPHTLPSNTPQAMTTASRIPGVNTQHHDFPNHEIDEPDVNHSDCVEAAGAKVTNRPEYALENQHIDVVPTVIQTDGRVIDLTTDSDEIILMHPKRSTRRSLDTRQITVQHSPIVILVLHLRLHPM